MTLHVQPPTKENVRVAGRRASHLPDELQGRTVLDATQARLPGMAGGEHLPGVQDAWRDYRSCLAVAS